jgi:phosphatidylethanolamine/phosphatidyl-N-methylethanolamine N-methyltransferase
MAVQYDLSGQKRAYATWAGFYDKVYLKLLADAQTRLAAAATAAGNDILEVGVGTGLVLRYYGAGTRVIGVDLSEDMLRKAHEKITALRLGHVAGVAAMDACRLGFPDARFDAVTFPFVITLVPDPEGALDEAARVLRPGGEIVIASKLSGDSGPVARIEEMVAPLAAKVGWSSAFKLSRVTEWAARNGYEVVEVAPVFPAGFFKLARLRKPAALGAPR